MTITLIVGLLVVLAIGVAAFGLRRDRAEQPAAAQTVAVLLIVVVAVLVLVYVILQRAPR